MSRFPQRGRKCYSLNSSLHCCCAPSDSLGWHGIGVFRTRSCSRWVALRLAFHDHPDSLRHLHVALVAAQRKELIRLWRAQEIGDETLHEIEHELDLEETRLRH